MTKPAKSLDALQDDARGRAREAEKRLLYVAQKGAGWKILEFFVQNTAAWGSLWYFLVSFIGVTYSWGFYKQLDIDIFSFFDTPDFLLSAFQNTAVLIAGVLVTFISIGILVYSAYNSSLYSAYDFQRAVQRYRVRVRREALLLGLLTLASIAVSFFSLWQLPQVFPKAVLHLISGVSIGILVLLVFFAYRFIIRKHASNLDRSDRFLRDERILLFIILIEATFIIPFLWGGVDSYKAREEASRSIKVTLSQDRLQTPLPDRTLFLGTTSSFHIFYECDEALIDKNGEMLKNTDGTPKKCEKKNGRPFVIPTANIASLEFRPDLPPHVDSPASIEAIADLNRIIKELKSEESKVSDAIIQTNTIIARFNRSSETHTKLIIPKIESPEPESVAHIGPDQVATAVVAFQSYLEGKIRITHLNKTITTLNETIKTLNQADVPDPDLANIVGAIKSLNPLTVENPGLNNIPGAIKSLNPLAVKNPAQDGVIPAIGKNTEQISEAVRENTTEISAAIRGLNISCPRDPDSVQEHCPLGWEKVTTIWPFPKEEHELEQNSDGQKKLNRLFTEMEEKFGASTLGQFILVGRSDARPVCKQTLALYGSSNGLAQGRAKWIWDELVKKFTTSEQQKALHDRTLLLSAGPLHVRDEASEMNRAKDRAVEVYACWTPKEPDPTSASAEPVE